MYFLQDRVVRLAPFFFPFVWFWLCVVYARCGSFPRRVVYHLSLAPDRLTSPRLRVNSGGIVAASTLSG